MKKISIFFLTKVEVFPPDSKLLNYNVSNFVFFFLYKQSYGQNLNYGGHGLKKAKKEKEQDLHKIPGTPGKNCTNFQLTISHSSFFLKHRLGVDYPVYHTVPHTSFHCGNVPATPGMYANVETGCQAYHVCYDGREGEQGASFLCTNGTIFNQKEFTCDWWYNVDCHASLEYYR